MKINNNNDDIEAMKQENETISKEDEQYSKPLEKMNKMSAQVDWGPCSLNLTPKNWSKKV